VENASVDVLPTNVWSWDRPGCRGSTIGSSGARWLKPQTLMKLTPLSGGVAGAPWAELETIAAIAERRAQAATRTIGPTPIEIQGSDRLFTFSSPSN
jgi:hypothetical protein